MIDILADMRVGSIDMDVPVDFSYVDIYLYYVDSIHSNILYALSQLSFFLFYYSSDLVISLIFCHFFYCFVEQLVTELFYSFLELTHFLLVLTLFVVVLFIYNYA